MNKTKCEDCGFSPSRSKIKAHYKHLLHALMPQVPSEAAQKGESRRMSKRERLKQIKKTLTECRRDMEALSKASNKIDHEAVQAKLEAIELIYGLKIGCAVTKGRTVHLVTGINPRLWNPGDSWKPTVYGRQLLRKGAGVYSNQVKPVRNWEKVL